MPRRGENIYKRKDGRWEGRYIKCRIDGKAKYGSVFAKTYGEVKQKLTQAILTNEQRLEQEPQTPPNPSCPFSALAWEWLDASKNQLKTSSVVKYTNILNSYLLPEFGNRQIAEISRDDIVSFVNSLLQTGGVRQKGLSPATVTSIISVLKNIMEYARLTKHYTVTDMSDITVKQPQKPFRVLSRPEQKRLMEHLQQNLNLSNLGILLCIYTGLRIGELCALKWEDISFEEKTIYVHKTMQRIQTLENSRRKTSISITPPKSDCSIRKIPIPEQIFQLLTEKMCPNDTYFLTGKRNAYIEPRTMENHFKLATKACNITGATFHTCRHTFATRCVELGVDIKSLSEILGHANVNITMNRYVHPSMELKQQHMNRLSELFMVK